MHSDLDPLTQAILVGAVAILIGAVLVRVAAFLRREYARVPHQYPRGWSNHQTRTFERFRAWIGGALIVTWAILAVTAARMPQSWPFGREEMALTVGLLLLTYAWVLLLLPSNWERTIANKVPFGLTMGALAGWWAVCLSGTLVAITLAAWRPPAPTISIGTYAHYDHVKAALGAKLSISFQHS